MRKNKKNQSKSSSIRLGIYFLVIVIFIIAVSFSFKVFDSIKSSKFDSGNHFTVAIQNKESTEIITVSPKEDEIKKLSIKGLNNEKELNNLGIPYDTLAKTNSEIGGDPRNYFSKFIGMGVKSNLSYFDIIKLNLATRTIGGDRIEEGSYSLKDNEISSVISTWFIDPEIEKEGLKIEITNTTDISGLGRVYADLLTNMGGNVVLVNSSQKAEDESKIYFKKQSYTSTKLSKFLEISSEEKDLNSVSDITIIIGKDLTSK